MAGVTTYTCNKCRPIDTEIIEAYEILTNTSKLVSQQEAGRVTAENERVAAEEERTRVFNADHGTASDDHTTAQADHRTAGDDHTIAVADHGIASDDHITAVADHGTASDDHVASTSATDRANDAAAAAEHMVDIHQGPPGPEGKPAVLGNNGNWWTWDEDTEQYVDTGQRAQGPTGATPNFAIGTVSTGAAGSQAAATITGTTDNPLLNLTIPQGLKGDQGNTGSSVDYPYELVNNETTDDATKGATAASAKRLKDELSQLEAEVHQLAGKFYGVFADDSDLPDDADAVGYAFVGATNPYAVWNFDGTNWSDSGTEVTGITGEPGVGFQSIFTPSPYDGTMIIVLTDGNTITVDLNHNHGGYYSKVLGGAQPAGGFLPDVVYSLGSLSGTITFSLASPVTGNVNHYFWMFDTGVSAPTITWPAGLTWAAGSAPTISASKHYEISILGGVAYYSEM